MTIGVLIMAAALLVRVALVRTRSRPTAWWTGVAAGGLAVAVLVADFQLTEGLLF